MTMFETILHKSKEITDLLHELLEKHSSLKKRPTYGEFVIFSPDGDHLWQEIDSQGKRIQSEVYGKYNKLCKLMRALLSGEPGETLKSFDDARNEVLQVIEQNRATWSSIPVDALEEALKNLQKQIEIIHCLYDAKDGNKIFIPDTNALIINRDLEQWEFKGVQGFEILILPTVVAELDEMKMLHRVPEVRDKADKIIKRLKGYRDRGNLNDGVPLVKEKSTSLRIMAVEPRMDENLDWLDPTNKDDRILASVFNVIKEYPRADVTLVTADLNLQNKAEFAFVQFVEPPISSPNNN